MTDKPVKPRPLEIEQELHACEACGYTMGFHVSFVREGRKLRIILICPNCAARYDVDWLEP